MGRLTKPRPVLHLREPVLVGPGRRRDEGGWSAGPHPDGHGRCARRRRRSTAGCCPGLVDAHCHVGSTPRGGRRRDVGAQALADRDAGALLLRDAGSAADTRWVDDRDDLPVLVRAGRTSPGHALHPQLRRRGRAEQLADAVRRQAARSDGWVKLVGDWIDRDRATSRRAGRARRWTPRSRPRTRPVRA
jgi:hypothetical protein